MHRKLVRKIDQELVNVSKSEKFQTYSGPDSIFAGWFTLYLVLKSNFFREISWLESRQKTNEECRNEAQKASEECMKKALKVTVSILKKTNQQVGFNREIAETGYRKIWGVQDSDLQGKKNEIVNHWWRALPLRWGGCWQIIQRETLAKKVIYYPL